jgi:hypothetical protein
LAAHATLRFVRLNAWPAGVRFRVLWNGTRDAATGEGKPNANPAAAVDEASPLTPSPIEIWPRGKAGHGMGPHGRGLHGRGANWHPGYGYGKGLHGKGEHGLYCDYVEWTTAGVLPTLRDGVYKFAVRLEDEYGTVQTESLVEVSITIKGVPRAPRNVRRVSFASGQLTVAWDHSLDLVDLA